MGLKDQLQELGELHAGSVEGPAEAGAGYSLELFSASRGYAPLTPAMVEKMRAAVAKGGKVSAGSREMQVRLVVAVPADFSEGGAELAAFEDEYAPRATRLLTLELSFPADYPEASPARVVAATSPCFRSPESAEEFEGLLRGYLDAFAGSPSAAAAVGFAAENAGPLFAPLYCACFLDVAIEGQPAGRLILELSTRLTPKAAENFRAICTGEHGKCKGGAKRSSGVPLDLCYRGTTFGRVIPGQFAHGGDLSRAGMYGGSGGESIYGVDPWPDENHILRFDRRFVVALANGGPNTNGSQFFVTFKAAPSLNDKHVVFGLCRGASAAPAVDLEALMNAIEATGTPNGKVKAQVTITGCGQLAEPNT